jgi:hypothetical protein
MFRATQRQNKCRKERPRSSYVPSTATRKQNFFGCCRIGHTVASDCQDHRHHQRQHSPYLNSLQNYAVGKQPAQEYAYEIKATQFKFGRDVIYHELGYTCNSIGIGSRAAVFTDQTIRNTSSIVDKAISSLKSFGIDVEIFDRVKIEPDDDSVQEAIEFAKDGKFDGIISIGGGSGMKIVSCSPASTNSPSSLFLHLFPRLFFCYIGCSLPYAISHGYC